MTNVHNSIYSGREVLDGQHPHIRYCQQKNSQGKHFWKWALDKTKIASVLTSFPQWLKIIGSKYNLPIIGYNYYNYI